MEATETPAPGNVPCVVEGCVRTPRKWSHSGKCAACLAREAYHRKHPDAPHREIGHHGKWKGKSCACGTPVVTRGMCVKCYNAQYTPPPQTPEQRRNIHLKHRYGITLADYNRMAEEQGGKCAVCREPPSRANTRSHWRGKLCVDHCHDSGKVRGLLCNDCNLAIGYAKTESIALAIVGYFRLHHGHDHADTP